MSGLKPGVTFICEPELRSLESEVSIGFVLSLSSAVSWNDNVLGRSQLNGGTAALAFEQVTIMSGLLHQNRVYGVSLLEDLLIRGPFCNEVGNERR